MGWIFGAMGSLKAADLKLLRSIHGPALMTATEGDLYLAAGGIPSTCLNHRQDGNGWVVCGTGLLSGNGKYSIMDTDDWNRILAPAKPWLDDLNGHFVTLKWSKDRLELFTDKLGLRDIYYTTGNGRLVFSTRLDWLCKTAGGFELDISQFGSSWLCYNQLSTGSIIKNISRLGPGGYALYRNKKLELTKHSWDRHPRPVEPEDCRKALKAVLAAPFNSGRKITLGLSGGLDSRLLLSLLRGQDQPNWETHTFGQPDHPDVLVAGRIARQERLSHTFFESRPVRQDSALTILRGHVAQTGPVVTASSTMQFTNFTSLNEKGLFLVDGGCGEFGRRAYLKNLAYKASGAVADGDWLRIFPFLRYHRGGIFTSSVTGTMATAAFSQAEDIMHGLPSPDRIGIDNWVDLLALRTRVPNFYGLEQSRLDCQIQNLMPFAQPLFLDHILNLPVSFRQDGNFYKAMIRSNCKALQKYPLVKDVTYPFGFNSIQAHLWTTAKKCFSPVKVQSPQVEYLDVLSEYINDTSLSSSVKSFPLYNYKLILENITKYYRGEKHLAPFLDWWLSFEAWRRELGL